MAYKDKQGDAVVAFSGKWISYLHTIAAYIAFLGALIVGVSLHYTKIVENEHYGYPDEWFPSVSATIGDRYPERSVFQLFICLTSGPRFALVFLWYCMTKRPDSSLPNLVLGTGIFRSLTCGGWTYVTSTDDHDWHDIFMISYLVATIPWTVGCLALTPRNQDAVRYRKIFAGLFFGTIVPLIYFFIQHKVHKIAGAYTIYAFFEWALVLFDVAFDAVTVFEFEGLEIVVRDVKGISKGNAKTVQDRLIEKEKDNPVGAVLDQPFFWSEMLDAVADVYNGFVFWSMLTSLGLLVWYFPLWHMGISGYEAFVMVTILPAILVVPGVSNLVAANVRYIHLASLVGVASYLVTGVELRLTAVGVGVALSSLAWSATWWAERNQPQRLNSRILGWSIGLILSSVAKFAFYTNNPIWPVMHAANGGWNKTGIALGVLAILRSTRRREPRGEGFEPVASNTGSALLSALSIGGLTFGLHSMLSDSSTMIAWVWEGFPVRGPIAANGVLTIAAMGAGLFFAVYYPEKLSPLGRFLVLAAGSLGVTAFSHWVGYFGGLAFAFGICSLLPALISSAVRHNPAVSFGFGFFVYNIMVLAHVWVVAYAFVPGGPVMREHTDWVVSAMTLLIGAGVFNLPSSGKTRSTKGKRVSSRNTRSAFYLYVTGAIQLLAISIAYLRFPTNDYAPYHPESKVITAGIWTIHFTLDNDMWSSEHRMRDLLKELEVDVVGLLESDTQRIIMGNRDTTQFLAEDLGMYVDFGPGPNKHTWGSALLSKFPIVNSTHHLLPSPVGELAPAIHATIDAYGTLVDVFVFHSGQEEDPEDRRLQSLYLSDLMKSSPRPSILLSYLVTKPLEGNYNTYVGEKSGMNDIDPSDWDRWCEYILFKGLKRTGYARVSRSTITDTELQVGKFVVGEPENGNYRIDEEHVAEGLRFPAMFRGEGVRGHRYHVFDEPRYFQ